MGYRWVCNIISDSKEKVEKLWQDFVVKVSYEVVKVSYEFSLSRIDGSARLLTHCLYVLFLQAWTYDVSLSIKEENVRKVILGPCTGMGQRPNYVWLSQPKGNLFSYVP